MAVISRRNFVVFGVGAFGLAACDGAIMGNGVGSRAAPQIDFPIRSGGERDTVARVLRHCDQFVRRIKGREHFANCSFRSSRANYDIASATNKVSKKLLQNYRDIASIDQADFEAIDFDDCDKVELATVSCKAQGFVG